MARLSDVPSGHVVAVRAGERWYALANVDGVLHAVDNNCPHNGGPLSKGTLVGRELVCPWHGWRWDVTTGANVNNPAVKIGCFPAAVVDGDVYVEMP